MSVCSYSTSRRENEEKGEKEEIRERRKNEGREERKKGDTNERRERRKKEGREERKEIRMKEGG